MQKEIGSNFWLNPHNLQSKKIIDPKEQFGCDGSDFVWLSSGRSAIRFIIKTIVERNEIIVKSVLLPPFICNTVIEPFIEAGFDIFYYNVDSNLESSLDSLLSIAISKNVSIVLFHRYFGFNTLTGDTSSFQEFRKHKIIVIDDCTQCLYSNFNKQISDYSIGSIRKWHGVPDGGFAVCSNGVFTNKPICYDHELEKAKILASYNKYKYLFESIGDKSEYLKQFKIAEDILDNQKGWFLISDISAKMQSSLDITEMSSKRIRNFETLGSKFPESDEIKPLFKKLDNNITPLYFPIIVRNRQSIQQYLIRNDIYAPVIWPKPVCQPIVCDEAEYLYEHLLCIPIDQRYDYDDMLRVISVIREYFI